MFFVKKIYIYKYIYYIMIIFDKQNFIYRKSLDIIELREGYIEYSSTTRSKVINGKNTISIIPGYVPRPLNYFMRKSDRYNVAINSGKIERNLIYSSLIMDNKYIKDIYLSDIYTNIDEFDCCILDINNKLYIIEVKVRNNTSDRYDGDLIMSRKYYELLDLSSRYNAIPLYIMYFTDNIFRVYNLLDIDCVFDITSAKSIKDCVGCNSDKIIYSENIPHDCGLTFKMIVDE